MGNVIRKKCCFYEFCIIILASILAMIGLSLLYKYKKQVVVDENKVRVDINTTINDLEYYYGNTNNDKDQPKRLAEQHYAVMDLEGNITYSNLSEYHTGEKISLHRLGRVMQRQNRYQCPLIYQDKQFGSVVIQINSDKYQLTHSNQLITMCFIILISLGCITVILVVIRKYLNADILTPINQIHQATNAIMARDYSVSVEYDYDGEIGALCHDFELMRTELKAYQERETLYKKKETLLLASISHDLKTPLATVKNYAEGIVYDVVESKEEIKEYAKIIISKITYLTGLINDILEHSKAGLNQFHIEKVDVYADDFFNSLCEELGKEIKDRSFEFEYETFPRVVVSLDKKRMTQVFRNLVDNSLKYGSAGGYIHITNQVEDRVVDSKKRSYLCIAFEDNGCGISASDLPYIFETFYRGDKARNQEIPGSGLGLNIAKYIINCHNGDITCESKYGQGTTFSISLEI